MREYARPAARQSGEGNEQEVRGGDALPGESRAFFESRFGHDFSRVRVHADPEAAWSARSIHARAYASGDHLVFGAGEYRPDTTRGHRLLAHELAHVAQQRLTPRASRMMSAPGDADEREATRAAGAATWGLLSSRYGDVTAHIESGAASRVSAKPFAFTAAAAAIERVELTYDDGPDSAGNTKLVLDALNKAGAKATFYLVGKRVAQGNNWKVVFDIAAAGHWIGNHAYDWNDAKDNHIFLSGTPEQRAQKILNTEWAIRDALIHGRDDAKADNTWASIPQANRTYIEDLIAHGTGRFRTPGFKSKFWNDEGRKTSVALMQVNMVLAATGLRPLKITEVGVLGVEGVTVDPEDWKTGKTQAEIESSVTSGTTSNTDSILLHSRIGASAAATPAIAKDISSKGFTFDPTVQGKLGSKTPGAGFLNMKFSDPPTSLEITNARAWFKKNYVNAGPVFAGSMALGIFALAQRAGNADVMAFAADIKAETVATPQGPVALANWMQANEEWRLFTSFFENWATNKPFPKIPGVTI